MRGIQHAFTQLSSNLSDLKNRSEKVTGRRQILRILKANSCSIGRKSDAIWTGQTLLQPISFKSDRLLVTFLYAVLLVSILGCLSTSRQEETDNQEITGEYIDDSTITAKVKAAISEDPALKSEEIGVETVRGTVQLTGFVSSIIVMEKAMYVARGVKGVRSVKDEMRLKWQH